AIPAATTTTTTLALALGVITFRLELLRRNRRISFVMRILFNEVFLIQLFVIQEDRTGRLIKRGVLGHSSLEDRVMLSLQGIVRLDRDRQAEALFQLDKIGALVIEDIDRGRRRR